ncbi:hypothetical protein KIH74_28555 [Kineosporia sp. J2-2]|uniref:Uncharacterized protein n=1 Tax=Kineosporia corallincola TaxID=2835133 RepID=A0ABS5TQ28_9ACTN|nr:hypothetical protein [Kineosporia corallincola]MBT0772928.1 hypothetical protein [Kineosporia corallincola]
MISLSHWPVRRSGRIAILAFFMTCCLALPAMATTRKTPNDLRTVVTEIRPVSANGTVSASAYFRTTARYRILNEHIRPGERVTIESWTREDMGGYSTTWGCGAAAGSVILHSVGLTFYQGQKGFRQHHGRPFNPGSDDPPKRESPSPGKEAHSIESFRWPEWASRGGWNVITAGGNISGIDCLSDGKTTRPSASWTMSVSGNAVSVDIEQGRAPTISDLDVSTGAVLVAVGVSPVVLAAVGFPAEIVNKTIEGNRHRVRLRRRRSVSSRRQRRPVLNILRRWVTRVIAWTVQGKGAWAMWATTTLLCLWLTSAGLFYGGASIGNLASGITAVLAVVLVYELPKYAVATGSLTGALSRWRVVPAGLALALMTGAMSQLGSLFPPYVYGLSIASRSVVVSARRAAYATVAGSGSLLATALLAWVFNSQSQAEIVRSGWLGEWLSSFFFAGLQGLVFALIPAKFLDGESIFRFRRGFWTALYLPLVALYVWIMFTGAPVWWGSREDAMVSIVLLAAFGILSLLIWLYFRFVPDPAVLDLKSRTVADPPAREVPGQRRMVWEDDGGCSGLNDERDEACDECPASNDHPVVKTPRPEAFARRERKTALRVSLFVLAASVVSAMVAVVLRVAPAPEESTLVGTPVLRPATLPGGQIMPQSNGEIWQIKNAGESQLSGEIVVEVCRLGCAFEVSSSSASEDGSPSNLWKGARFSREPDGSYVATWSVTHPATCGPRNEKLNVQSDFELRMIPLFDGPDDFGVQVKVQGQVLSRPSQASSGRCSLAGFKEDITGSGLRTG